MGRLRGHSKEEFWQGADARIRAIGRSKAEVWDATVVEVGAGADAGKVKVLLPGETTPTTDLPFAPVIGPTPAVNDQVVTVTDAASRRVITGEDHLLYASTTLESALTGATLLPSHYYNISTAGAAPTLESGDVDPSTTTEATRIIVIRCIVDCTINAPAGQFVNGTLTSFAMPAFSSVILAARGTTGWAVLASSGVPAFTPTTGGSASAITGEVRMFGGSTPPSGWFLCQGQAVSRTDYAGLYAALGGASSAYGQGDGSTTFNLPDFRGRVPMGVGTSDAADGTLNSLGQKRGAETHTLSQNQMPAHTHSTGFDLPVTDNTATTGTAGRLVGAGTDLNITSSSTGGGAAHNNLQPSLGVNFIIKS